MPEETERMGCLSVGRGMNGPPKPEPASTARVLYRQGERERRPLPELTLHPDPPPVRLDSQAAEGQAQAQSLRVALLVQAGGFFGDGVLFAGGGPRAGVAE